MKGIDFWSRDRTKRCKHTTKNQLDRDSMQWPSQMHPVNPSEMKLQ